MKRLSDELRGDAGCPIGYVSFLSALVHHGALVDGITTIQVASPDRAGTWSVEQGLVEYAPMPRDLWFGWKEGWFEGDLVPPATPEKALIDWCWLAEELGVDPRLHEIEWGALDIPELDRLAAETGVRFRHLLRAASLSGHDQERLREERLTKLR